MAKQAGDIFGRLTLVRRLTFGKHSKWLCLCSCGKEVSVIDSNLRRLGKPHTTSCGCFRSEVIVTANITHGEAGHHGLQTTEYSTWADMKRRCGDPNRADYINYGGRGITVCDRWLNSFENFLADMGRKPTRLHSIERDRVNEGYSPDNCRWATRKEQNRNTRASRWIEYNGERKTLAEWAEITGFGSTTLLCRLRRGWSVERTLTLAPVIGRNQVK